MGRYGSFSGPIQVEFNIDGRTVTLLTDINFTDPMNIKWPVPKGTIVDGASIPRAFWPTIGGPFEGPYRDASVIHDYYCDHHIHTWQMTHRVFYYGMRTNDVNEITAQIMYFAVRKFGPRWPTPGTTFLNANLSRHIQLEATAQYRAMREGSAPISAEPSIDSIITKIKTGAFSLDQIDTLAEQA